MQVIFLLADLEASAKEVNRCCVLYDTEDGRDLQDLQVEMQGWVQAQERPVVVVAPDLSVACEGVHVQLTDTPCEGSWLGWSARGQKMHLTVYAGDVVCKAQPVPDGPWQQKLSAGLPDCHPAKGWFSCGLPAVVDVPGLLTGRTGKVGEAGNVGKARPAASDGTAGV
jgi:hypothetical protein